MQCLEVSGAVRLIYRSLGVKGLIYYCSNIVVSLAICPNYLPLIHLPNTSVRSTHLDTSNKILMAL